MEKVCVVGLGYIGLPTASILAAHGFNVTGVDVTSEVVDIIKNGEVHINEPGLHAIVKAVIRSGKLRVQGIPEKSDVFIIAVPTPITEDKKSNLEYIKAAAESIAPLIEKKNLIILESTSPPGTCKDVLVPIFNSFNLNVGTDYYLAYCPERVLPGNTIKEIIQNDRIIGGIDEESSKKAAEFYGSFVEGKITIADSTTAEMVKLMENTYRDVNIALANELAKICKEIGINAWKVVELANLHPRVNIHFPGPGVGGHCIAVDPYFILEKYTSNPSIISVSRRLNDIMPNYVASQVKKILINIHNPKVAILGVAYKANIDDTRGSSALRIITELERNNLDYSIYDPLVKKFRYPLTSLEDALQGSDCILLLTDHEEFKKLKPNNVGKMMRNKRLYDSRHCLNHELWKTNGFKVFCLGIGEVI